MEKLTGIMQGEFKFDMEKYERKSYKDRIENGSSDMDKMPEKCKDCVNCTIENGVYCCSQVYCIRNEV
ncbi:MAG: hypothetical protein ACIAQZ_02780 [Sedimentisphaeraceae bacterium JB056]